MTKRNNGRQAESAMTFSTIFKQKTVNATTVTTTIGPTFQSNRSVDNSKCV
jgi:hypothetical protein